MRAIKITLVLLLFCQAVLAQKISAEEMAEKKVLKLDEKVTLTETQKAEINTIVLESTTKIKELRSEESADQEAIKKIKMDERAKIKEVLTEEQQTLLKNAKKSERVENKAQREKMKAYNKEHVKPVVAEKRKGFELLLTDDEKASIAAAHSLKLEMRKVDKKDLSEEEKSALKAKRTEINNLLDPIITKHQDELTKIKLELEPVYEAAKQNAGKEKPEGRHHKGKKHDKKPNDKRFEHRFLLSK